MPDLGVFGTPPPDMVREKNTRAIHDTATVPAAQLRKKMLMLSHL